MFDFPFDQHCFNLTGLIAKLTYEITGLITKFLLDDLGANEN